MGLTSADLLTVVASLSSASIRRGGNFSKSMTTHADHTIWQDRVPRRHTEWQSGLHQNYRAKQRCAGHPVQGEVI